MLRDRFVAVLVSALALLIGGCDETDLGSVRVSVHEDLSGRVTVVRIVPEEQMAPAAAAGVTWDSTAGVVASVGDFKDLSQVRLADIVFSAGRTDAGVSYVKVTLPRSPQTLWPGLFLGASEANVQKAAATLTDASAAQKIGRTLKLKLMLPGPVVSEGLSGSFQGVVGSHERAEATLVVPLDRGREDGAAIVWHVTWEGKK